MKLDQHYQHCYFRPEPKYEEMSTKEELLARRKARFQGSAPKSAVPGLKSRGASQLNLDELAKALDAIAQEPEVDRPQNLRALREQVRSLPPSQVSINIYLESLRDAFSCNDYLLAQKIVTLVAGNQFYLAEFPHLNEIHAALSFDSISGQASWQKVTQESRQQGELMLDLYLVGMTGDFTAWQLVSTKFSKNSWLLRGVVGLLQQRYAEQHQNLAKAFKGQMPECLWPLTANSNN